MRGGGGISKSKITPVKTNKVRKREIIEQIMKNVDEKNNSRKRR